MKLPSSSWRPGPSRDVVPLTRSRALCSARQPKLIATVVLWSCAWRPPSATMRKELLRADGRLTRSVLTSESSAIHP